MLYSLFFQKNTMRLFFFETSGFMSYTKCINAAPWQAIYEHERSITGFRLEGSKTPYAQNDSVSVRYRETASSPEFNAGI